MHLTLRPERDPLNAQLSYYSRFGPSGVESRQLDLKLDDGMPYTGKMRGHGHSACTDSSSETYRNNDFIGTDKGSCTPMWFIDTF